MPIVRYRTRDLTRLLPPTSRAFRRMGKIVGRSDDMMIIRGVNVFPTQVEEIVLAHSALTGLYQVRVQPRRPARPGRSALRTHAARGRRGRPQRHLRLGDTHRVKTLIGISTRVVVHGPDEMERTQTGKARRVIDTRPR